MSTALEFEIKCLIATFSQEWIFDNFDFDVFDFEIFDFDEILIEKEINVISVTGRIKQDTHDKTQRGEIIPNDKVIEESTIQ